MTVARRRDGRLLLYNAIPLDDTRMAELEAWGTPAFLVVPSPLHRLDLHAFRERYPGLQILTPSPMRAAVSKVVAVQGDLNDFPPDADLSLVAAHGTGGREALLLAHGSEGTSVCFGDLLMNLTNVPGLDGLLFRLLGSVGGPRVTRIARMTLVEDRREVRGHLEELAPIPGLVRLIPSHGDVVATDAAAVLRGVAARLGLALERRA